MTFQTLQRIHKALYNERELKNESLRFTEEQIKRNERKDMVVPPKWLDDQKRISNICDELDRAIEEFNSHDWH
mgnify:FL=1|jgi:hypothetical protein